VKTDIKKRTTEAQRWQKKAKKIRSGMGVSVASGAGGVGGGQASSNVPPGGGGSNQHLNAANQELLRAADAAQNDLNSRLALLQVLFRFTHRFIPVIPSILQTHTHTLKLRSLEIRVDCWWLEIVT